MPPKEIKDKPAATPKQSKPKAKAEEKKEVKQAKQVKAATKGKHPIDQNMESALLLSFLIGQL
jgi:hypothetical protein